MERRQRYLHELLFLFRCNFLRILLWMLVSISLVGSTYYMSEEAHKDLTSSSPSLRNVNASSTIHCASHCEFESACTSYSFNSLFTNASCVLYASTNLTFDVPEPGRQHFKKSEYGTIKSTPKLKGDLIDRCADNNYNNVTKDGVTIPVICDGGRIMVQRRWAWVSNKLFNADIKGYESGFGDPSSNYWIGNENLHLLSKDGEYRLEAYVFNGTWKNATFEQFVVSSQADRYRLTMGNISTSYTAFEELLAFDRMEFYATGFGDPAPASSTFFNGGGWWKPNGNVTTCFNCFSDDGATEIRLAGKTYVYSSMLIQKK